MQTAARGSLLNRLEVIPNDRAEIRIDDDCLGAVQQLDARGDGRRADHVAEARLSQQVHHGVLMPAIPIAVSECHSGHIEAVREQQFGLRVECRQVRRAQYRTIGAEPFVHFDHAFIERCGSEDLLREQVGAGLRSDVEEISEPSRDEERAACAPALEQCIRAARGRQTHRHGWECLLDAAAGDEAGGEGRGFLR
jgi:hypothetical protein